MHDNDVIWNDAPIPLSPYFFTQEAYDKYSIAGSFRDKLAAKDEDLQAASKAAEEAASKLVATPQLGKSDVVLKKPAPTSLSVPEPPLQTASVKPAAVQLPAPTKQTAPIQPPGATQCSKGKKDNIPEASQGGQTGRSKKLAPPRFSYLTTAEQRAYVDWYQKYSKFIPTKPNKNEAKDIEKFKDLQVRVQAEQQEFQDYLERAAYHMPEVYQYIHPDASQFMQEWLDVHRARVYKYPRYYVALDSMSLVPPKILKHPPPFQHIQTLLQVGVVPKAILPNMNVKIKPKVPLNYKKLKNRYPLTPGSSNKKVCSADENLEKLARKYGAKIAMSSSSIQCLLDNQTLNKAWELPVVVKTYTRIENGHEITEKLVFVDKPFPERNMTTHEKNMRFYRLALKTYLLHPGHQKSLKFDKFSQPVLPKQRVLETAVQESCFDSDEVDIVDLETFGTFDMSPTRCSKEQPKLVTAAKAHKVKEDVKMSCAMDTSEVSSVEQDTTSESEIMDTETQHVAKSSESKVENPTDTEVKKEDSDKAAQDSEPETVVKDALTLPATGQLRRSTRRSRPTSTHHFEMSNADDKDSGSQKDIPELKGSKQDEKSEEEEGCSKKPLPKPDSERDLSDNQPVRSRATRSSSRVRSEISSDSDSTISERRIPATKESLHISAESSPMRKVELGGCDSDKEMSKKGKKGLLSPVVSQSESEEDTKLVINEEGTQNYEIQITSPRVTRHSSSQSLTKNIETTKTTEATPKGTPIRRSARISADNVLDTTLGTEKQSSIESEVEETIESFSDAQTDSDADDDKLVIDEPKDVASGRATESEEKTTLSRRRTRSKAATNTEGEVDSIKTVTTRRSKRLSSEHIDDILTGNAMTPKRTRSKDATSSVTGGESLSTDEGVRGEGVQTVASESDAKTELVSPASPSNETQPDEMQMEISPASPTMTDETDKQSLSFASAQGHQYVKEIPLSPTRPFSPSGTMHDLGNKGQSEIAFSEDLNFQKNESSGDEKLASKHDMQEDVKSTLDSILKAQSAMLQTEKSPQHALDQSFAGISQMPTSSIVIGTGWNAAEKSEDFQSPDTHNFTYNLWQLGNIPLIIRCSFHGNMRDKKQNLSYISLNPKLEYQYPYGVEHLTSSDICRAWISSCLRNNCSIVRARINVSNSDMILLEKLPAHQVLPPRSAFNPTAALTVLHNIMESLLKLPEGKYLLSHTKDNTHAHLKKSVERKGGVYDLHTAHTTYADTDAIGSPVVWIPVDPSIILPAHKFAGRVPATFDPKDSNRQRKNQPPKKKKKKRKKVKPQS